jgi:hypothetical protein
MLRHLLALLVVLAPVTVEAQPVEDAAHRADRLRTQRLNRAAGLIVSDRNRGNAVAQSRYRTERADYERRMDEWRGRVAACRNGDVSACDHR